MLSGSTLAAPGASEYPPGVILSTLVYVRSEGRTLMIRKARGHQKGMWNGLGGKFEPGETPEECARREVREEAGLEVGELRLHGVITFPLFDSENDWYVFVFSSRDFEGQPASTDEGDLHWIRDELVPELELHEGDRIFLPWLEDDRFFSAKFVYEHGQFRSHEVAFY